MKKLLTLLFTFAFALSLAGPAFAKEGTWTGRISDSMCNAVHKSSEHGKMMNAYDCTIKCVKDGAKYVFVSGGKVYKVENQDFAVKCSPKFGQVAKV